MGNVSLPADADLAGVVRDALEAGGIDGIEAVYVFGSAAEGRVRDDSDVDLAFLASRPQDTVLVFDVVRNKALSSERLGVPQESRDAFIVLEKAGLTSIRRPRMRCGEWSVFETSRCMSTKR
jgi:predicted nucleotidyltransferase